MMISVEMAAQILGYLPVTEIADFKRVNKIFGTAVERFRQLLPKPYISVALDSRKVGNSNEKHARVIIVHKHKSFAFGINPCCSDFESGFPLDGFVHHVKGTRRRISSITDFFTSLLKRNKISVLHLDNLTPEWMFMYKFILNMAAAQMSEVQTAKMQFNPKRDNLALDWFQTTMFIRQDETPPKVLKLSSAEPYDLFEIEELVNILSSLGDHYPEVYFVLNREWIYAAIFRTLALWLTDESIDTFKFSWCFEKSDKDATAEDARYIANTRGAWPFGRGRPWNRALNWMYKVYEFEHTGQLINIPPQIFQSDSYIGHKGLHSSYGPPFIKFQSPNGEDAHRRGGDSLQFNIRKQGNLVFITTETI